MNNEVKGLRLIITIVARGKGKKVSKIFEKIGCNIHQIHLGYGTVTDEVLQYLGLATIEKDVVFSLADEKIAPYMLSTINEEMNMSSPGQGIACSIPIQSVAGKTTLNAIIDSE
ncbi:MAG: hypothetical protein ACI32E_05880 [Bacilli bacterium]